MGEKMDIVIEQAKPLTFIICINEFSDCHVDGVIIAKRNVFYIVYAMKSII